MQRTKKYTDQELIRIEKLEKFSAKYGSPYNITKSNFTLSLFEFRKKYASKSAEELSKENNFCVLSGRIVTIRQTFLVIQSMNVKVQLYINKETNPTAFEILKNYIDVGDIVEASGHVMRTMKNELTLHVNELKLLSKALKPLPEKYHGLVDVELRARKRYLDLISNNDAFETFLLRSKIIGKIRFFLNQDGYIELETPILTSTIGGAAAKPFKTYYNSLGQDVYLRIATEIALKKLIVGGFEKIYELGRVFRNEGMDSNHNPEFTTIEIYLAYGNMFDMMDLTEKIIQYIARELGLTELDCDSGSKLNLVHPFRKCSMNDLIKEEVGIDFLKMKSVDEALAMAEKYAVEVQPHQKSIGHIMNLFFAEYCEKKLIQPTFVIGHPVETSPLAKRSLDTPGITERFELFIFGQEIANAYSELNDPIDQRKRFDQQLVEREQGNCEASDCDEEFLDALEYGLPPTGGLGIGIDRLVMLFAQKKSMRDVLLFPHMKSTKLP